MCTVYADSRAPGGVKERSSSLSGFHTALARSNPGAIWVGGRTCRQHLWHGARVEGACRPLSGSSLTATFGRPRVARHLLAHGLPHLCRRGRALIQCRRLKPLVCLLGDLIPQQGGAHLLQGVFRGDPSVMWHFGTTAGAGRLSAVAEELSGKLRLGHLVQFVGAGASAGLWRRAGIPPWQALLDRVAEEAGVEPATLSGLDPRDQATVLSHHLKKRKKKLASALTVVRHGIPWRCRHGIPSSGVRVLSTRSFPLPARRAPGCLPGGRARRRPAQWR